MTPKLRESRDAYRTGSVPRKEANRPRTVCHGAEFNSGPGGAPGGSIKEGLAWGSRPCVALLGLRLDGRTVAAARLMGRSTIQSGKRCGSDGMTLRDMGSSEDCFGAGTRAGNLASL